MLILPQDIVCQARHPEPISKPQEGLLVVSETGWHLAATVTEFSSLIPSGFSGLRESTLWK
jgi:hypothetical protein